MPYFTLFFSNTQEGDHPKSLFLENVVGSDSPNAENKTPSVCLVSHSTSSGKHTQVPQSEFFCHHSDVTLVTPNFF
jgi:hypothetical protein